MRILDLFKKKPKKRKYDGATKGRRGAGWFANSTSANSEVRNSLPILRDRSRDLVRNNPYANHAITLVASNTVGRGIMPSITHENEKIEKAYQATWKNFVKNCDFDGMQTFYGLQNLAMKSTAESGEILIRRRISTEGFPLKLQILESDFIATNKFETASNGNKILQGIEFDENGQRVAYHLYSDHPGNGDSFVGYSNQFTTVRVPAEDIAHIYRIDRPGQIRGIPWLSSAMLRLRDFDDFEDAQLVRQKIAAAWSVFITDVQGSDDLSEEEEIELGEKVEPGMIELLPPGRDVKFASPPGVENYKEYTTTVLKAIAAGIGISYEALTGDYSDVNYSSARMGWLEFSRNIDSWRSHMLNPMFNDKIFGWFLDASVLTGMDKDGVNATWTAPRREMLDPTKEVPAKIKAIRAGIETLSDVVRQNGGNLDDQLTETARINESLDAQGIVLDSDARTVWQSGRLQDQNNQNQNSQ